MNNDINDDIIKKIEGRNISENKKRFLKEALELEYKNRDVGEQLKNKYVELVNEYYR